MTSAPVVSVTDELLVEIERVYLAGWEASGEGWNAEYPGDAHETKPFIDRMQQSCLPLTTELRRLRAENEALRVDAGRYRWLRNDSVDVGGDTVMAAKLDGLGDQISNWLFGGAIDSAIDTAMKSNTEGN
jgi:hypothetical protein